MGRIDTLKDAARRLAHWASTPAGLAWLFVGGLALRLLLARGGGFPYDMQSFAGWADRLANEGPAGFYPTPGDEFFVDYPPGYLYVLWLLGTVGHVLGQTGPSVFLIKLPAILADLVAAGLAMRLGTRLIPPTLARRFPWRGVIAAAVLFNPAVFFVSATWGQVDSILAALVLGAFLLLGTGTQTFARESGGIALLALAVLTKPQAVFVLPVVGLVLLWRHVRGRIGDAGGEGSEISRAVAVGTGRVAGLGLVGLATILVVAAPFRLWLVPRAGWPPIGGSLIEFFQKATKTYEVTSVFAFNLWGAVGFWRPDAPAAGTGTQGEVVRVLGIPALYVGYLLFAVGGLVVLWLAWRALHRGQLEGRVITFGGIALTLMAFAVLTRIHERYLFVAVVLLAPFLVYRALRWSFVTLSVLYLVNVYFPWAYYVNGFEGRSTLTIPFFDVLYGSSPVGADLAAPQLKLLSLGTAAFCVFLAVRGWRWMEVRSSSGEDRPAPEPPVPAEAVANGEGRRSGSWALTLHPIGRLGVALAFGVFLIASVTRLVGLGDPPGMYFDEVYHARTAGEYIRGKEVYEWTHPPLAKELMALSISRIGGFGVAGSAPAPDGLTDGVATGADERAVWVSPAVNRNGVMHQGRFQDGCGIREEGAAATVQVRPTAIASDGSLTLIGGEGQQGPVLVRFDGDIESWRVPIGGVPSAVAIAGGASFAVDDGGTLWRVDPSGNAPEALAAGVSAIAGDRTGSRVWAAFGDDRQVVAYPPTGEASHTIAVTGVPAALVAPPNTGRLLVADAGFGIEAVDLDADTPTLMAQDHLTLAGAERFAVVGGMGLVWAVEGAKVSVIEPRGMAVIGEGTFSRAPSAVLGDGVNHQLVGVTPDGLECFGGRPGFAWRFGSALFGGAMAALAALLALRLFGSLLAAGLAGLFVTVDGLAFTLSRIAMNDSYVTAFILATWFAALSVLYHWSSKRHHVEDPDEVPDTTLDTTLDTTSDTTSDAPPGHALRSRWGAIAWLAATGVFAGLALASKWVGLWAILGVGLLFWVDVLRRGRFGILSLAGGPVRTVLLGVLLVGAVPLGLYVLSYIPYFQLGHSFGDLWSLQQQMYGYHAGLDATHPFSSPWYGWPIGRNPVYLFLGDAGARQAQIWTVANPVVFIGGLLALGVATWQAWRRRSVTLAVLVGAALVQFLPWTLVGRVIFLYHYLPVVPFAAIALGWWLAVHRNPDDTRRRRLEALVVAGGAVAVFVVLLPLLAGLAVDPDYLEILKNGLRIWIEI